MFSYIDLSTPCLTLFLNILFYWCNCNGIICISVMYFGVWIGNWVLYIQIQHTKCWYFLQKRKIFPQIKQFFICIFQNSAIPLVYTRRNLYFLSPWLHISTRAFSMDEDLGCLRQVSLLVGCHGLMLLFSQNLYVENLIPKVTILDGGTIWK